MANLDPAAQQRLDDYLAQLRALAQPHGLESEEVAADIELHIRQEVSALSEELVSEDHLRDILARLGSPEEVLGLPATDLDSSPPRTVNGPKKKPQWLRRVYTLGVGLPVLAIIVEFLFGIMGTLAWDPMPTVIHLILLLAVPLTYARLTHHFDTASNASLRRPRFWFFLLGLSFCVSLVYSLVYIPTLPISAVACLVFGAGLLGFAPLTCLISGVILLHRCHRDFQRYTIPKRDMWRWTALGTVCTGLLLGVLALPFLAVERAHEHMLRGDYAKIGRSISLLGAESVIWKNATGRFTIFGPDEETPGVWHNLYYLAMGEPLEARPPFRLRAAHLWPMQTRPSLLDPAPRRARTRTRIPDFNLRLTASTTEVRLGQLASDPALATGYLEWVMELTNSHRFSREADALVQLPPGGVVSRLTLWVNGEEQEAAYGGRSQTMQAYQDVAIVQQRDPALVTTEGGDQIRLKVFPVLPETPAKVKLGITFPLVYRGEKAFVMRPKLVWTNFHVPRTLQHNFWMEAPFALTPLDAGLKQEPGGPGAHIVRGQLSTQSSSAFAAAEVAIAQQATLGAALGEQRVEATLLPLSTPTELKKVLLVLDAARPVAEANVDWHALLNAFPPEMEVEVVLAGFRPEVRAAAAPEAREALAQWLEGLSFPGGTDSVPGLTQAWEQAAADPATLLLWLHGPQPYPLSSPDALLQLARRRPLLVKDGQPRALALALAEDRNLVLESLTVQDSVVAVPILEDTQASLHYVAANLKPQDAQWRFRLPENGAIAGADGGEHLARLGIASVARTLALGTPPEVESAREMSVRARLVTPVSGAVVLERAEQYAAHGLDPGADPGAIPAIPEPEEWVLLLLLLLVLGWVLRRKRQRAGAAA